MTFIRESICINSLDLSFHAAGQGALISLFSVKLIESQIVRWKKQLNCCPTFCANFSFKITFARDSVCINNTSNLFFRARGQRASSPLFPVNLVKSHTAEWKKPMKLFSFCVFNFYSKCHLAGVPFELMRPI